MIERARVEEAREDAGSARFVVSEGSALVDLLAGAFDEEGLQQILLYLSGARRIPLAQWPRYWRKAPGVWLLNVFDVARPSAPDVLVLTLAEPGSNEERGLQEGYARVAGVLRKRRVDVVELTAGGLDAGRAAAEVEEVVRRHASKGTEAALGG